MGYCVSAGFSMNDPSVQVVGTNVRTIRARLPAMTQPGENLLHMTETPFSVRGGGDSTRGIGSSGREVWPRLGDTFPCHRRQVFEIAAAGAGKQACGLSDRQSEWHTALTQTRLGHHRTAGPLRACCIR